MRQVLQKICYSKLSKKESNIVNTNFKHESWINKYKHQKPYNIPYLLRLLSLYRKVLAWPPCFLLNPHANTLPNRPRTWLIGNQH